MKLEPRDDTVLPAVCFEDCSRDILSRKRSMPSKYLANPIFHSRPDNAVVEAQSEGKSSALCAPNGTFHLLMDECNACIVEYADPTAGGKQTVDVRLLDFLEFCTFTLSTITIHSATTLTNVKTTNGITTTEVVVLDVSVPATETSSQTSANTPRETSSAPQGMSPDIRRHRNME
jgi:hypothetical protein